MDVRAYLDRIGYNGLLAPTAETLRALHRQHMLTVPFENLDIRWAARSPSILSALCRRSSGSAVEASATSSTAPSPPYSRPRATLSRCSPPASPTRKELRARNLTTSLCASISKSLGWPMSGFGDNFLEPLRLTTDIEQQDPVGTFRFVQTGERWRLEVRQPDGSWRLQYDFSLLLHCHTERWSNRVRHPPDHVRTIGRKRRCPRQRRSGIQRFAIISVLPSARAVKAGPRDSRIKVALPAQRTERNGRRFFGPETAP